MSEEPLALEKTAAVLAVERACRVCRSVQSGLVNSLEKEDRSPATVADYAAQAVASHTLAEALAGDMLLGEEQAADLRRSDRQLFRERVIAEVRAVLPGLDDDAVLAAIDRGAGASPGARRWWVLDPLDGTKGFLRRQQYAVALALIEDGEVVLGALGCPELPHDPASPSTGRGCIFAAVRGRGTHWRALDGGAERRVHVDAIADASAAVFCESVEAAHSSHRASARIFAALGVRAAPCRMDSQCKYAAVARGEASVYLRLPARADYQEKVWDHAAGALIVEEAGGTVTDLRGAPLDFSRGRTLPTAGIIVTNRTLHRQVLAAAQEVMGVTKDSL